jgi:hypothetical protein
LSASTELREVRAEKAQRPVVIARFYVVMKEQFSKLSSCEAKRQCREAKAIGTGRCTVRQKHRADFRPDPLGQVFGADKDVTISDLLKMDVPGWHLSYFFL